MLSIMQHMFVSTYSNALLSTPVILWTNEHNLLNVLYNNLIHILIMVYKMLNLHIPWLNRQLHTYSQIVEVAVSIFENKIFRLTKIFVDFQVYSAD